jgi:Protein of unknown function (DUF2868)
MNEEAARRVTLLQAFETAQPPSPNWSDDDRAWATRLAMRDDTTTGEAFIARRAEHAMQRLAPREPAAAKWLAQRLWQPRWFAGAAFAGFVLGLVADSIGSSQRINLLAPPLGAVLVWNAVVYALLLGHALARAMARPTRPGVLVRAAERAMRLGRALPGARSTRAVAVGSVPALRAFASLWLRRSAPLNAARAAGLLHVTAAALAVGLIAGLYLRGLVFDYRAAWESTFLSANAAHAVLAFVLAPASAISGIALPDAAAFEALRSVHGGDAPGASAAPWIHLIALTLALFVVVPRSVLAVVDAMRARWLAGRFRLPAGNAYFERLLRQQHGEIAHVVVLPHAHTPGAQAALGLQALLVPVLGEGLQIRIEPTTAFDGDESESSTPLAANTTLAVALFDLSATPEAESQGRFARAVAARAPAGAATIVLVDEAAFTRRFGRDSQRLAQRREAWRKFAEALGTAPVIVDLDAPEHADAAAALRLAQSRPIARAS